MADSVDLLTGQLPLKGVVLCCTALLQDVRTHIAEIATQMGADHKLDLTADVTHLIVGSITTPKYKYVAKDRPDIKVLDPKWIEAVRSSWMEGGDVDVEALEKEHCFPTFGGLQICVTGFGDVVQRDFISSTVEEHGAVYSGDLTKSVTHLITAVPEGAKYTHARLWHIPTVSLRWFEDSLQRGMALDESLYDPTIPSEEQGKGAFRQHPKQRTSLGKHERDEEGRRTAAEDASRKKLRRTMSSRLDGHSQEMWSEMSTHTSKVELPKTDQWKDEDSSKAHVSGLKAVPAERARSDRNDNATDHHVNARDYAAGLLSGCRVVVHGFDTRKTALLSKVLQQNGATIENSSSVSENASERYHLVPHESSQEQVLEISPGVTIVTEWWVERCIHYKRLLKPDEDVLSQPVLDAVIDGFADLSISTTGFSGVDLRQVAEAVKLVGGSYEQNVNPSSSVLISGSSSIRKEKAFYADKHNIPVVSPDWLWACLKSKIVVPFEEYKIELPTFDLKDFTGEISTSSPAPSEMLQKKLKDELPPKRLSSIRKRHATPSLPLQATKAEPTAPRSKPEPIVHEDRDDAFINDADPVSIPPLESMTRADSQPLREISPNLSPRKGSNESANSDKTLGEDTEANKPPLRAASPTKPASPSSENQPKDNQSESHPPSRPQHEIAADLAEIVNRQNTSRPSSAAPPEPPQRRKSRPLGRASSGVSNRSLSLPHSASVHSESQGVSFSGLTSEYPESVSHSHSVEAPLPPSTQLGYETHDAEQHRLQMSKRMGTRIQEQHGGVGMQRVASLGTVKDSGLFVADAGVGVGNRVKGRKGR